MLLRTASVRKCRACRDDIRLPEFTMAFQPIVDVEAGEIFAHEALVRPPGGGTAADILNQIDENSVYAFDQHCRVKAVQLAAKLGMQGLLSINFLPNAVYQPAACLRKTLDAANRYGFRIDHLIFEVTENEQARDTPHLVEIFREYQRFGMKTAIDDFGAGHSGLALLADFQPDFVKIDMALTRHIEADRARRAITHSIIRLCSELGIQVIAEGVETLAEAATLRDLGVRLFQGYLLARPALEQLPPLTADVIHSIRAVHETMLLDHPQPALATA
jgi:EAL domain-containing protein (putative c-di-GMP-specific phosphodiesterase class I)